jgi:hypothetical protein
MNANKPIQCIYISIYTIANEYTYTYHCMQTNKIHLKRKNTVVTYHIKEEDENKIKNN